MKNSLMLFTMVGGVLLGLGKTTRNTSIMMVGTSILFIPYIPFILAFFFTWWLILKRIVTLWGMGLFSIGETMGLVFQGTYIAVKEGMKSYFRAVNEAFEYIMRH